MYSKLKSLFTSSLDKQPSYSSEYNRFEKAIRKNSHDHSLKAQFIKFCLQYLAAGGDVPQDHLAQVLRLYEEVVKADVFDPQVPYLLGKYYQGKDDTKAAQIYMDGIKHFVHYVGKNPSLKSDYVEPAYAMALYLLTLRAGEKDSDLEKFFKIIRKSYPLHLKQAKLETEMAKAHPDKSLIRKLAEEIKALRASEKGPFNPDGRE